MKTNYKAMTKKITTIDWGSLSKALQKSRDFLEEAGQKGIASEDVWTFWTGELEVAHRHLRFVEAGMSWERVSQAATDIIDMQWRIDKVRSLFDQEFQTFYALITRLVQLCANHSPCSTL